MNAHNPYDDIVASWAATEGIHSTEELLRWIEERNETVTVSIRQIMPEETSDWRYLPDEGIIANRGRSFFTIAGYRRGGGGGEQPIILQKEIGYLGILCKRVGGVLHFLMQAKIEPGNVNKIQISPTLQATMSNYTQKHGGGRPPYLDYFLRAKRYDVLADQVQSEQAARFLGKRNRNIVLLLPDEEDVPLLPCHRWMTLGQIKALMRRDNMVNMDTRTVLSCIPYYRADECASKRYFSDRTLHRSVFSHEDGRAMMAVSSDVNDSRMFGEDAGEILPLEQLNGWRWRNGEFVRDGGYHFKIIFCDIAIEGREVRRWTQPLFAAMGRAFFGLLCAEFDGALKFLVRLREEIGSFDGPELGPTVQMEADETPRDEVEKFFFDRLGKGTALFDGVLSEEGGRFYHEQNRNVVLRVEKEDAPEAPQGYFWLDFGNLNRLTQHNNCLNIQLRNLLSLLEA